MGDLDTNAGQAGAKLLEKTLRWNESFYDYGPEKIKEFMIKQKRNNIVYIEYSFREIGLTNKWFIEISNEIGNPLTVRREILLQRMHGSDLSPFDREDLENIIDRQQEPIDIIYLQDFYELYIYSPLSRFTPYLVGVDCSTGTNGDNNAMTILDPYTLVPVAEFKCPFIGEPEFERVVIELVTKYIPKAVLCIERNSVGSGIIAHLVESKIGGNIYYDRDKDLLEQQMKNASTITSILKTKAEMKKYHGVFTGPKSRQDMMTILANHVKNRKETFVMKFLIEDLCALIKKTSGRIEAKPGSHDDNVMSYLIALYVFYHGDNLASFGVYKDEIDESKPMEHEDINIDDLLPPDVAGALKKEKEFETLPTFESELQSYGSKLDKQSIKLYLKGLLDSEIYDNTRKEVLAGTASEYDDSDYSLFDDLNSL